MNLFFVRSSFVIGFIIAILIICFFAGYTYYNMQKAEAQSTNEERLLLSTKAIDKVVEDAEEIETLHRIYVISGNRDSLQSFYKALEQFSRDSAALLSGNIHPNEKRSLGKLLSQIAAANSQFIETIRLKAKGSDILASDRLQAIQSLFLMENIRRNALQLEESDRAKIQVYGDGRRKAARQMSLLFIIMSTLFFLFLVLFIIAGRHELAVLFKSTVTREVNKGIFDFKNILERISDGFIAVDKDWKYVYVNDKTIQFLGKKKGELIGKKIWELYPEEVGGNFYKACHRAMEQQVDVFHEEYIQQSGTWFENHIYPSPQGLSIYYKDITERKISEEKYRTLVDRATDGIFIADQSGKFIMVNESGSRLSQYSAEELSGMTIYDLADKEELKTNPFHFDEMRTETGARVERKMRKKDGTLIDIEVNARFLSDGRFLAYIRDITDRKKAEEEKAKAKELADKLIDSLPGVFYFYDAEGKFIRWNKQLELVTGYNSEEISRMHPTDLFQGEEKEYIIRRIKEVFEKGISDAEAYFTNKEGKRTPYYFKAVLINYEGRPCLLGSGIDISERKKAEEELRLSEKRYRTLVEQAADLIVIFNDQGYFTDVNSVTTQVLGYSRDEMINMPVQEILLPENRDGQPFQLDELQSGDSIINRTRFRRKDGSVIEVEVHSKKLPDGQYLGIARDLTERLMTQKQLEESVTQIRELTDYIQNVREEERTHIAREIHDELGQQLTVMKMDISWLNKKIGSTDEQIQNKLRGLTDVLDGTVTAVRRISSELRPSVLDDLGLIAAMDWHLKEFGQRFGLETVFAQSSDDLVMPEVVKTGLYRIFQESLTNVARHAQARRVTVNLQQLEGRLRLLIEDDGKGFNILHVNKNRTLGILGMKERTTMMGGTYDITSEPGKGTVVTVSVPLQYNTTVT